LHNTLVTLIEKHQSTVEMQKDLKASEEQCSLAQDRVLRAQQAVVDSHDRVVQAQENLIDGLSQQLEAMQRLQGEIRSHVVARRSDR
jgi:hypothetical protein